MHRAPHLKIYHSKKHLVATIILLCLPFLFILFFTAFAKISLLRLLTDTGISLYRIIAAYLLAVVIAWLLAIVAHQGKISSVALPLFDVLQSFPTFAALPLATLAWGPSGATVIIFLVFTIVWPIFFSVVSALRLTRHDWQEAVKIYRLQGFAYVRYFLVPVTLPAIITGSIIGLGDGWEALIATEIIVGVKYGLGTFFRSFTYSPGVTAFGILGFLLLIFSINKLVWLSLLEWSHQKMEE